MPLQVQLIARFWYQTVIFFQYFQFRVFELYDWIFWAFWFGDLSPQHHMYLNILF